MPKVSVITIFLNAEKFLEEAIQSVRDQSFQDWELILVDDGSTDRSSALAKDYARRYPEQIRYVEHAGHKNLGTGSSRNAGLCEAQGEYVAFLDSDDVWLSHKLHRHVEILDRTAAAMVYGPAWLWHGWTGKPEDIQCDRKSPLGIEGNCVFQPPGLMTHFLDYAGCIPATCSAIMARRQVIHNAGGFEEKFKSLYEDQVLYAKMALNYPIYVDDDVSVRYRQHEGSICHQAEKAGAYDSKGGASKAEWAYLQWLAAYIRQKGIHDARLGAALKKRSAPYRSSFIHDLFGGR